ncbi:Protein polybromo-1 [Schistosoma japonicum]|nr:Protein polybromo-1 [Schistosoma japonicum]KAH8861049.1 Protein polybromo-1 [Schistosoma japonicum]
MPKRSNPESPADSITGLSGDESQSSSVLTRKRCRLANASQLDLCQELFDRIRAYRGEDGSLSDTFMRLPTRRSHADYYEAVREPMDLARIQAKIKACEYESVDQMATDINLIVANTKSFYPASTTEFAKAVELQDVFDHERQLLQVITTRSTDSTASSASSSVTDRRTTRRRAFVTGERDEEEAETLSITASDDSRTAPSEVSTTNLTSSSQPSSTQLDNPYELLFASIAKYVGENDRPLAPTFTHLPSRELYPVYYVVIKEPIDLRMIARKISSGEYNTMDELEKDFLLLARNAKTFNEPKSVIYQDAVTLARILKGKRSEAEHPPVRTNRERGKRASRLNYVPHEIVKQFASIPDLSDPPDSSSQMDESTEVVFELSGDDEDTQATGTSQSCSSAASVAIRKKRGRPRRNPFSEDSIKRSPSREPLSPASIPSQYNTNGNGYELGGNNLPPLCASRAHRRLQEKLLQVVLDSLNEDGQPMSTPFFRLPSRRLYPDYYEEITNPLCLSSIKKKIKRYEYSSLDTVLTDLDVVFNNAQQYNVEQSAIHQDSIRLQQIAHKKCVELKNSEIALSIKPDNPETASYSPSGNNQTVPSTTVAEGITYSQYDQTPLRRPGRQVVTGEEATVKRLQNLYKAVYYFRADDGHFPRDTFVSLPSKDEYPDYYQVILNPIDLTMIKHKMDEGKYSSHDEMVHDLQLMFNNACSYNEEGSSVYNDAKLLDSVVKKRIRAFVTYNSNVNRLITARSSLTEPMPQQFDAQNIQSHPSSVSTIPAVHHQQSGQQPTFSILQRVMLELFQTVREYQVNGRVLSNPFMRLPTRNELPTYYEFIKRPVELQSVAKQLVQMKYNDFEEFAGELFLMFDNACRFNEPDSQIYADALMLHRVCLAKRSLLLSTHQQSLSIPSCVAPDVPTSLRRLLTNLHNSMLTACDADGRGLVDSLIAGDGTETTLTSVTAARLAALHRAVADGAYHRLDSLQSDWLGILARARIGEGSDQPAEAKNPCPTKQQRLDAAELARRWVRLRDELCHRPQRRSGTQISSVNNDSGSALPTHVILYSPALSYTEAALERDITEENEKYKLPIYDDENGEEILSSLPEGQCELKHFEARGQVYHVGDYVYVEPMRSNVTQCHIGRITRISRVEHSASKNELTFNKEDQMKTENNCEISDTSKCDHPSTINVRLSLYFRPAEAHPSRRRRLLAAEVFRTAVGETVQTNQIMGRCLVMHISQFIRYKPKNLEERDVFICESQFSIRSQLFVKVKDWNIPLPTGIELEARPIPFVPTRLPPNEPLGNALEQVDNSLFVQMHYPLPWTFHSIVLEDRTEIEGIVVYEQYVHENGFLVKLGDFLYVPSTNESSERSIVRVDKLWKSCAQNAILFTGPWFVTSSSVDHLPTRLFYPKEVFLTGSEHATHALASATGKCYVMRPCDYSQARPTEISEQDVYMCDSKYFETEKVIRKLKKGLKKFQFTSENIHDDEFYFFSQQIMPRKDASPLLAKASIEPLQNDQLNRPVSLALTCVLAAAAGTTTTMVAPPIISLPNLSTDPVKQTERLPTGLLSENTNCGNNTTLVACRSSANAVPTSSNPLVLGISSQHQIDALTRAFIENNVDRTGKKRKIRKPPSGYVLYAGEVRKKLLQERPDAPFGEISREVGLLWRQMPTAQRDIYEQKAHLIRQHMAEEEMQIKAREQEQVQLHLQQQIAAASISSANISGTMPLQAATGVNPPSSSRMPATTPPSTMQFYQTPSGQVIQIVHASSTPNVVGHSTVPAQTVTAPLGQPASIVQTTYATIPAIASACPVATPTHQIVYQLSSQQSILSTGTVSTGTPQQSFYQPQLHPQAPQQQQRVLVASSVCSTPTILGTVIGSGTTVPPVLPVGTNAGSSIPNIPQAQILLSSTGSTSSTGFPALPQSGLVTTTTPTMNQPHLHPGVAVAAVGTPHIIPSPAPTLGACPQDYAPQVQSQYQLIQQVPQSQPIGPNVMASVSVVPGTQFIQSQPQTVATQSQAARPSSPLFVSVPPRTSRVLHSEIYQRYISRLRKNAPGGLGDWHNQLSASLDTSPSIQTNGVNQLVGNFFSDPKKVRNCSVTEALWNLREYLLEDALKIRLRCLSATEC